MRLLVDLAKIGIGVSLAAGMTVNASAKPVNFCDSGDYTTIDLNNCTAKNLKYEDDKLNKSYKKLRGLLDSTEKNQLKKAQLAWIKFRDSSCEFKSRELYGGSAYTMEYTSCLTGYTYQRRVELDNEIRFTGN